MKQEWNKQDAEELWDLTEPHQPWKPDVDQAWKKFSVLLASGADASAMAAPGKAGLFAKVVGSKLGMAAIAAAVGGAAVYSYQALSSKATEAPVATQMQASVEPKDSTLEVEASQNRANLRQADALTPSETDMGKTALVQEAAPEAIKEKPQEAKPIAQDMAPAAQPETKILRFRQTELKVVAEILSQTYGVQVRIDNSEVAACKLTATFANESLETVLMIIQETFNFELKVDGKTQVLKGGSCS